MLTSDVVHTAEIGVNAAETEACQTSADPIVRQSAEVGGTSEFSSYRESEYNSIPVARRNNIDIEVSNSATLPNANEPA